MTPELSRVIALSKIGPGGLTILITATPKECADVTVRMGLPAIRTLECRFDLLIDAGGDSVLAKGRLHADVTQVCVVSAQYFEASVDEEFEVRFVPEGTERDDADPDLPDEVPYGTAGLDLGEVTAEQLGLALDPYPRIEGATVPRFEDITSGSPFAALLNHPNDPPERPDPTPPRRR